MKREDEKEKQKAEKKLAGMMEASNNDGYAECYPGLAEMDDAVIDSDDEADYSKMDMGNKKGPVGRCVLFNNWKPLTFTDLNLGGILTQPRSMRITWAIRRPCPRPLSSME